VTATAVAVHLVPAAELRHLPAPPRVLDVRTPGEFAALHAVGAVLMPLDQLDPARANRECRAADGRLYVVCQAGTRAAMAAQRLLDAGLQDVWCVEGGTAAWQQAGLPVVRGRGVISLERQVRIGAGSLVVLGCVLGVAVSHWGFLLSALVGAGLVFAGITDICGLGLLLARMPWNRSRGGEENCRCS